VLRLGVGDPAAAAAHTSLTNYIIELEQRLAAIENSPEMVPPDEVLLIDELNNAPRALGSVIADGQSARLIVQLAQDPGDNGAVYTSTDEIPNGIPLQIDFGPDGTGQLVTASGAVVTSDAIKSWIIDETVVSAHRDGTDLVIDWLEPVTAPGSSLSLGDLYNVEDSSDSAPAGMLFGTTENGQWGAVLPPPPTPAPSLAPLILHPGTPIPGNSFPALGVIRALPTGFHVYDSGAIIRQTLRGSDLAIYLNQGLTLIRWAEDNEILRASVGDDIVLERLVNG
jgi:hypothetical protein